MLYQTENPHGGDVYSGSIRLDFSANTNPLGTPPGVLKAIEESFPQLHRYPDVHCRELVKAISDFEGVKETHILCGSGAAELIYSYCRALGPVQGMQLAPTFCEYASALKEAGGQMISYYLKPEMDFRVDGGLLDCLKANRPQVLFLCNPNNPTGLTVQPERMEKIIAACRELGCRLFVDECFLDLCDGGSSVKGWLEKWEGLFILKAFTKSYGMAGIRLGYCLCADRDLLTRMGQTVQPWNVSTLAQAAGVAALGETEFLERTRELIRRERPILKSGLEALGMRVCPSQTNYLLFQGKPGIQKLLRERGIGLRSCANYPGLDETWYRTAVRTGPENAQLLQALAELP